MSRIVGLIAGWPISGAAENSEFRLGCEAMLQAISVGLAEAIRAQWQTHCWQQDSITLGWAGRAQPNQAVDGDIAVVIDGSLYNRSEWEIPGNDAALVVALYRQHGFSGMLQRLNGDFAIALYDGKQQALWLGRDRLGVRPLYYWQQGDRLAFASRPRPLLTVPGVSKAVNRQFVALFAASHYRTFDNDIHASPYADIRQLPAAHCLCYRDSRVQIQPYWQLTDLPDWADSPDSLADRYRELLLDAVTCRLAVVDRAVFTLSGGMDSSSVLACAVKSTGQRQHAFSTVYRDKTYDESDEIRSMLDTCVEQWHPIEIDVPDVFDLVAQMIAAHDEPVATATWLSHFVLCGAVQQKGFQNLFGGLGGDELNAGEYEYFPYHFADLALANQQADLDRELAKWSEYHDHPIFQKTPDIGRAAITRLTDPNIAGRCLPDRDRLQKYIPALNPDYFAIRDFEPIMDQPFSSYLKNRTYQDLVRETAPCCLRAEDRQTTAFGLGHLLPFLDYRLVEFMYRVPGSLKIASGVTKQLLRSAMQGTLPEETRLRIKKTGWNAPAHIWFTGNGRDRILDWVHSSAFQARGIYTPSVVETLLEEHRLAVESGNLSNNHMMFLWQLVNLETWMQSLEQDG